MANLKLLNPVLSLLDINRTNDKLISIKENDYIDSNFIITHLMKQFLNETNSNLLLILFHNNLGHYQNIGKRLGYDFIQKLNNGIIKIIEPINDLIENIDCEEQQLLNNYLIDDKELIVKNLFKKIKEILIENNNNNKELHNYLIIDDISHLLDLDIDLNLIINFINSCINLNNNENLTIIINTHVSNKNDEIICNNLNYMADVSIEILPLKTGISQEVTGIINIKRCNNNHLIQHHFKAYDKGIKTFYPGESLYNLYK